MSVKNKKLYDRIVDVAEKNGWTVNVDDNIIEFGKHSPAGEDFSFTIEYNGDLDEFLNNFKDYYDNYDPDTETYKWLDEEGHGRNGAPYRMRDLLDDKEAIERMIEDLMISLGRNVEEVDDDEERCCSRMEALFLSCKEVANATEIFVYDESENRNGYTLRNLSEVDEASIAEQFDEYDQILLDNFKQRHDLENERVFAVYSDENIEGFIAFDGFED